jgi:hypothetical protein
VSMFFLATLSVMAKKKNPHALAMVRARLRKLSPARRAEIAKAAAAKRWEGHEAKRPASSRKKAGEPGAEQ